MGIASIFHYFETSNVVGQRIFDRYYITKTKQTLFLVSSITYFFQIISKTKFTKFSYFILLLGSTTQGFVDHSRFAVFPFLLIAMGFLSKVEDYQKVYRNNYLRVDNFLKIKK